MLHNDSFDNFFTDFAGQARIRWHYGVAHSILCSFEDRFIAETGRGWLLQDSAHQVRTLVRARSHIGKTREAYHFTNLLPRLMSKLNIYYEGGTADH